MKVTILNEYHDKGLKRLVKVGEVLDLDDDRIEQLKSIGIDTMDADEDELLSDDLDDDRINTLIESYRDDKNIVDDLKSDDLKTLCDHFEINYTNVSDAKESLKILTIS